MAALHGGCVLLLAVLLASAVTAQLTVDDETIDTTYKPGDDTQHYDRALYDVEGGIVFRVDAETLTKKILTDRVWPIVVNFYLDSCAACREAESEVLAAAKALNGVVPFAAINCEDEDNEDVCEEYTDGSYPRFWVFRPRSMPVFYRYEAIEPSLINFALGTLDDWMIRIPADGVDKFVENTTLPRAVYFSAEPWVDPSWNAVGFVNRLRLFIAQADNADKATLKKYGVNIDLPALVFFAANSTKPIVYPDTITSYTLEKATVVLGDYALDKMPSDLMEQGDPLLIHQAFNQPLPESEVEHIAEAITFNQSVVHFPAHSVVLFYHKWHPTCRRVMVAFEALAKELHNEPIEVVALDYDASHLAMSVQDRWSLKNLPEILFFAGNGSEPVKFPSLDSLDKISEATKALATWARSEVKLIPQRAEEREAERLRKEEEAKTPQQQARKKAGLAEDRKGKLRDVVLNLEDSTDEERMQNKKKNYEYKFEL